MTSRTTVHHGCFSSTIAERAGYSGLVQFASDIDDVIGVGAAPRKKQAPAARSRMPSVLVVDDDPSIRETIANVLRDERFVVATAGNGQRALEVMRGGLRPAALLLDLWMPELDGQQVVEIMRSDEQLAHIPIIVITAGAESMSRDTRDHVDALLKKPLDLDVLIDTVEAHTRRAPW
jgi:CheY-like chemotaxis protein